jgi:hypothetical protein
MQKASSPGKGCSYKTGPGIILTTTTSSRPIFKPRNVILTIAILWSSFLQLSVSNLQPKKPILIDSIFSQPDKLQLRFRPMGHYAASTFTSHIRIPFDYSALLQLQDKMIKRMDRCIPDLDRFNFNLNQRDRATLNSTFEIYKSDLKQVFKLFNDLLASLPHVPERQRRQWDVASFIAATAALTLSTYNTIQISKLETAIEKQQQKTDLLADIVHIHEQHLHQLDTMIEDIGNEIQKLMVQAGFYFSVDRAIAQVISDSNKLRAVITIFERVINSAFDQKLAPGALSVDVLDTIFNHINDTAAQNKFHSFIHQPSDLYKLEMSFIHRPEEHTIILILHVPYVETENLLPLYEFISLPIYFNFSSNVSVILDVGKQDLIAIGNTEAFQTLSSSDLANCKCLGKTFFCEGRSVLQTNIVNDCLGSLYLGNSTLIKNNCKFRINSTREKIYRLGNNTWLVYSIGTIATNQVCPKTNTLSPITIKSGHSITVQAGCNIPTMDHLISEDNLEETEILNSWLDWTMSLPELFNHEDTVQLTAMIKDIRKHINGDFDASQLLKQLDNVQKPFSADHWQFSSPAVMLGLALLLSVIAAVIWKKCCAQAPSTAPPPAIAAPLPAPPPQIHIQPAPQPQMPPPQPAPPAYTQQNPTFNFSKPTAPVLIYT